MKNDVATGKDGCEIGSEEIGFVDGLPKETVGRVRAVLICYYTMRI